MKNHILLISLMIVATLSLSACNVTVKNAQEINDNAQDNSIQTVEETDSAKEEKNEPEITEAQDQAPDIDISGCDTFTQIVDSKLTDGMGYANENISGVDVLLVSSGTYDNLDGNMAAIDAALFMYKDGSPYEIGKVQCGGTAYPLAVKDAALYAGGNHWICKYEIDGDRLIIKSKAVVTYDENGNETYSVEKDGIEENNIDNAEAEKYMNTLFDEMTKADIINFDIVSKKSGMLPPYEYPGPELFYTVLYQYMIDELAKGYSESDVTIPCPVIVAEDESDNEDIKVWGDFQIYNYDLNGQILECASGGSYPGCIHVKCVDDARGYVVTEFEQVGDGSDYDPTAKKIFGKYYEDFIKSNEDTKARDELRAQIISNYAADNNLDITAFADYGWDPVPLPPENIDNFYSILD